MRVPSYLTADLLGLGIISLAAFFKALKSSQYYDSGCDANRILTVDSDYTPRVSRCLVRPDHNQWIERAGVGRSILRAVR